MPVFLPSAGTVVRMHSRVTAMEVVSGEPCWKVETDFAGTPATFWIVQESRRLVQQVMRLGPDLQLRFQHADTVPRPLPPSTGSKPSMVNHPRRDTPLATPLGDPVDATSRRRATDPVLLVVRTAVR